MKKNIITGLLAILPVALTWIILIKLFEIFINPGSKILKAAFGENISQYIINLTAFLLTLIFIYFLGLLVTNIFGKKIVAWFDKIISKIPIAKTIYRTIKQITTSIAAPNKNAFQKVVLIEYPRRGLWTITMVTGSSKDKENIQYYHIFVPTTPNPTSGFMLLVPKSEVRETEMSVEDGLKSIISGGMIAPEINDI